MVTRAADYALRATLALAALPPGARLCLSELAAACEVPPAFLYKVLGSLARGGLLVPHRGVAGGYELTTRARAASVLDVVEAVHGLPLLNACVRTGACHRAPACPAHPVWWQAQERLREILAGARIEDLAGPPPGEAPSAASPRRVLQHAPAREHPCVETARRRPARPGRPGRGTHRKRMGNR